MKQHPAISATCSASLILCTVLSSATSLAQGDSKVVLRHDPDGYHLVRNGSNYFIKGAGGDASRAVLREAGGNSFRTWGADAAQAQLDEAQKLGLTVSLGIWLGHREHGFDYSNADQLIKQMDDVHSTVLKYRNHPALLVWSIGNEMEGDGSNAAVWSAINNLAAMVKKLDPNHPVMTVIAEIGGNKVRNINALCPDVDIIGINSYGGGPSLAARYKAAGGVKPYIVTEFGPPGIWEAETNAFGVVPELTSTAKAKAYAATYTASIKDQPLCLGSYAFAWGNKQEATATWFGMLLPDGSRLGAVDALSELWTGQRPPHPVPAIQSLKLQDPDQADPGSVVHASLTLAGADLSGVKVTWVLQADVRNANTNGATEAAPPTFQQSIIASDARTATIKLPANPGVYRLFAYVRDANGSAAVANVPLLAKGKVTSSISPSAKAALPVVIYDEAGGKASYAPSGYMGNTGAVKMEPGCTDNPHSGKTCLKVQYGARDGWAGVVWQDPPNDWGDAPGGLNLAGATQLSFWARGDSGGEKVTFLCGLIKNDKPYYDTSLSKLEDVILTKDWKRYSIDLKGKDLARIKCGFAWTLASTGSAVTFYLDDIRVE